MLEQQFFTVVLSSVYDDMMLKFQDVVAYNLDEACNKCLAQMAVISHWVLEGAYVQDQKEWVQ